MKNQKHTFSFLFHHKSLRGVMAAMIVLLGWTAFHSGGEGTTSNDFSLHITRSNDDLVLTWSVPDVVLQTSQTLNGDWLDLPEATSPHAVAGNLDKSFFRLRKVSTISGVEPAFLPTSGGTLYVRGVNFDANSTVTLNGVPAGPVTFVDSALLLVNVAALGAGHYDVAVVNGASGPAGFTLSKGLTVESAPLASLEVPPGMAEGRTATGEINLTHVDLQIDCPVGPDFVIARTHRSRHDAVGSPFGTAWDFSCNISVAMDGADVVVNDGSGRSDKFFRQPNGTFQRAEFFREGSMNGQVFTLTLADKTIWTFRALDAAVAPGKIAAITDRNGNAMTFSYGVSGRLDQVTDALGRTCQFSYNGSGQLVGVTDFAGRTVGYYYVQNEPQGSDGDLKSVTSPAVTVTPNGNDFPLGKTVTYTYTKGFADERLNHNLTGVIDNTGVQVQTITYTTELNPAHFDFDRSVSIALGANPPTVFSCEPLTPSPANRFAKTKVTMNDPVGNVSETLYDSKNRPVSIKELTGRATPGFPVTAVGNQPTNKLRASDPAFFETTLAYNIDSQVTQITEPRGNSMTMTYAYDLSRATPARERGNLRQVTQTPAPGVPSDQAKRVENFAYQPGFGTLEGVNSREINSRTCTCPSGFYAKAAGKVSRHTDPRGNVTTGTYDANGNCLSLSLPGLATVHSFEYNAAGQMTAHVHPADANGRRKRDTFSYYSNGTQKGHMQSAVEDAGAGGLALTTTYAYGAVGNVTSVTDPRGNDTQFVFNQLDQLMQVKSAPGGGAVRSQVDYTYDAASRISSGNVSNFDSEGNPIGDGTLTTSYGRDSIGRLTSVTREVSDAVSTVTQFQYDAAGQLTNALSPLAVSGAAPFNTVQTQYDERGLPFQEISAPGSPDQSTTQYDYDANGNVSRVSEGLEGTPRTTTVENDGFSTYGSNPWYIKLQPRGSHNPIKSYMTGGGTGPVMSMEREDFPDEPTLGCFTDEFGLIGMGIFGGTGPITSDPVSSRVEGLNFCDEGFNFCDDFATIGFAVYPNSWDGSQLNFCDDFATIGFAVYPNSWVGSELNTVRPASITDPQGNITTFHYDASGNCTSVRKDGEANDVPGSAGNVKLAEASFNYDAVNRPTGQTNQLLSAGASTAVNTSASFADNGATTTVTDALGRVTTFAHDTAGRVSSVTDPKNNSVAYSYDANGNVLTTMRTLKSDLGSPDLVFNKSFAYDKLNRCTSATDNVGNTENFAYDSRGNVVRTTDARGIVSQFAYDGLSRLTRSGRDMNNNGSTLDPVDIVTSQSWDANSRLTSQTDPNGNVTSYGYASPDRLTQTIAAIWTSDKKQFFWHIKAGNCELTQTIAADGTTHSATYDVHGNVVSTTDPNGTVTTYNYDLNNRLLQKTILPVVGVATTTSLETFAYDGLGRLTQASNNASTTSFTYDSLGRTLTETQNGLTVTSTYDAAGNRLTVAYPGGRTIGYAYDAANLPTTVSLLASSDGEAPGVLSTNHYIGGQLERVDNRNNTRTSYSYNGVAGTANPLGDSGWGQVSRVQTVNVTSGAVIEDTTYRYDAAQNQTGKTTSFPGKVTAKVYQYDAADRLVNTLVTTNGAQTANITYTLDKAGNRLNVTGDNHPGVYTLNSTLPEPADFQVNQYTTTPVGNFSYDKNGNRTAETSGVTTLRTFSYDYANRLVAINSGSTGTPIAVYGYDALGRRILKGTQSGATLNTTRYVYDGGDVIEERDGGGNVTATFTTGKVCGHYTQLAWDTGRIVTSKRNGTNYWPATDADGSTVALTLDNGSVAERYDYADFGAPAFFDGSGSAIPGSAVRNTYLFGGIQYDEETGLYARSGGIPSRVDTNFQSAHEHRNFDPRTGSTLQRNVGFSSKVRGQSCTSVSLSMCNTNTRLYPHVGFSRKLRIEWTNQHGCGANPNVL